MTDYLSPCPFCGTPGHIVPPGHVAEIYSAYCTECYAEGPEKPTRASAIRAWNRDDVTDSGEVPCE